MLFYEVLYYEKHSKQFVLVGADMKRVKFCGVSENYSESAILKLTKMILSIFDDYNLNDFYINSDVCIEYADLLKLKDLAREIIGDYDDKG